MKPIRYTPHLSFRIRFRKLPWRLPEEVYLKAKERYRDTTTGKLIAVKTVRYQGKLRDMMVAYQELAKTVDLITIHPLKKHQKQTRIRSGRWRQL